MRRGRKCNEGENEGTGVAATLSSVHLRAEQTKAENKEQFKFCRS